MISKKNIYMAIIFGAALLLFFQRLSFFADTLIGRLFNVLKLHKVGSFFGSISEVVVLGLGVLFCYMTLPDNYKNLDWLKRMTIICLISYFILCVINSVINVFNFRLGMNQILEIISFLFKWLFPNFILFIALLLLTFRVHAMKEDKLGPPKLP